MNVIDDFIRSVHHDLSEGEQPEVVNSVFGQHGVHYGEDENGTYAIVGFSTNKDVYAEIEDGTYGTLQGWRIYYTTKGMN